MPEGAPGGSWKPEPRAALLTDSFMHKHCCVPGSGLVTGSLRSSSHLLSGFELLPAPVAGSHVQDTALSQEYISVLLRPYSSRPL